MTADLVIDALEMAIFSRRQLLRGVIAHSDAGSQYVSVAYTERLAEIHALLSIGSIGDSSKHLDNQDRDTPTIRPVAPGPDQPSNSCVT